MKKNRRKQGKKNSLISVIVVVLAIIAGVTGHGQIFDSHNDNSARTEQTDHQNTSTQQSKVKSGDVDSLAKLNYQAGQNPVEVVNNDVPTDLPKTNYNRGYIEYSNLDGLNRTGTATAYLTKNNLGHSSERDAQSFRPTGWHNQPKTVNGKRVFPQNRGHLIAYTITFNIASDGEPRSGEEGSEDNPKNLFTQSAYSNQRLMQETEEMVRNSLSRGNKVIYKVTPIFRGNELMARGVWVRAQSADGSMHFNRYIFNVQPDLSFDYVTGQSKIDHAMQVPQA